MSLDYAVGQQQVLTLIARGRPLQESLTALARWVEQDAPTVLCSIMTADESGTSLHVVAAPSLPATFVREIDQLPIGPASGICGTAAYRRAPVVVADTLHDPLTSKYREVAREHDIRAGWSTPILSSDGTLLGTFALYYRFVTEPMAEHRQIVHDATALAQIAIERQNTEHALRQAQKMEAVGQLAGGIAHDFNNILAVIKLNAEMLAEMLAPDHPGLVEAEEIDGAAERAGVITRQLLGFSRRQPVQLRRLSIADVVAETEPLLRRLLGNEIDLDIDIRRNLGPVLGDSGQFGQVLMNLAMNARDAMPAGGHVRITARQIDTTGVGDAERGLGRMVELDVADTGIGIPDRVRDRIFEPFFTTKAPGKGTGLGLAMAYAIVRQSGGEITVESTPGRETVFHITLPIAVDGDTEDPEPEQADAEIPGGSETVLLVEDELALRRATARTLGRLGYTVIEARHGRDALLLYDADPGNIDLVVSDLVMPEMGGRELLRQLRQRRADLPMLIISGYDRDASGDQPPEPRVLFLGKPFTLLALARRCRAALDRLPPD